MEHITLHCPQCAETLVVPQAVPASALPLPRPASAAASPPAAKPASGLATASLVLGTLGILSILSLFIYLLTPVFAIPAIICGHVARKRALRGPTQDQNATRARIGMSLGCLGLVICLVGILLPAFGPHGEVARPINCAANLKQIGLACKTYSSDYSEKFPPDLTALWKGNYLTAGKIYTCPSTHTTPPQTGDELAVHCDYLYFGGGKNEAQIDSTQVLGCDKPANHRRYINVIYGDGHVAEVKGDFKRFLRDNHLILPAESAAAKQE